MADLPPHPIHAATGTEIFDVFIAGSGPLGATYARILVEKGFKVVMAEIGDQETRIPAAHKKNEVKYQKDMDSFVRVVQGDLSQVSVPISSTIVPELDPSAWNPSDPADMTIYNGRNPFQQGHNNLGAEAVTRCVGGMATHWTCATPEFFEGDERPKIFPSDSKKDNKEWKLLYKGARKFIGTSTKEFDESIRHNTVLDLLKKTYEGTRVIEPLPLACSRIRDGNKPTPYVMWHGADHVYGNIFPKNSTDPFQVLTNTQCVQLFTNDRGATNVELKYAVVKDLLKQSSNLYVIRAKAYVLAAGAIGTPQILANSGFGGLRETPQPWLIPSLGKRITEQPLSFCQIVLRQNIVEDATNPVGKPEWWVTALKDHKTNYPQDPLGIPFHDPEPQVTIRATPKHPWHVQIHRDAFSYGEVGPRVDPRLVVDLRFFGRQAGDEKNVLLFEGSVKDAYEMPQPTFEYLPTRPFAEEASRMMLDMTDVANKLGGYLPGAEPQFMTPGLALHLGGTIRIGHGSEVGESVANYNCQVWKFKNLYVSGNGNIPTAFAANPTLTSIAIAIRGAQKLSLDLKNGVMVSPLDNDDDIKETEASSLDWLLNTANLPPHGDQRALHRVVRVAA